jgi:hypothetical protein
VICVAAPDQNDNLASFSNYGGSVDLAAPAVDTTSTWPAYDTLYSQSFEDQFSPVPAVATSPAASAARWPTTCAKPPCVVPNLVGANLATAKARIKARHRRAERLASGAKVNLWLGKGPAKRR